MDPDQNIVGEDRTFRSECQGSRSTAHESNTKVLEICEYGEPIRDLKGGGGGGACNLHAETGSCSFPILPSPLNFAAGSCCRCKCPCPCPPVETCPFPCPPKPVESCLPGIHKQYRDVYSDCKENHLPIGYKTVVEHDDLYLPRSRPLSSTSNYCSMPMPSRSCSPPYTPPPTQRCHCECAQSQPRPTWDVKIPESKVCLQTFVQEEKSCCSQPSPKRLASPTPQCLPLPDPLDACHCLPSPIRHLASPTPVDPCRSQPSPQCLPLPDQLDACNCLPSPKRCLASPTPVDPCHSQPSPKRLALPAQIDTCCFPPFPERLALPAHIDTCCFPPFPKRLALLAPADTCCFPPSPKRLALPAPTDICCMPSPKRPALPTKVNASTSPSWKSSKSLALPARVSGGMDAEHDTTIPEPADVSVKSCVDNEQKPSIKSSSSQKHVQRIYVCLPYPSNSFPTSPNRLPSPLKPLPSNDEKNQAPVSTLRSELNQTPVSPPPLPLPYRCQECVSQRPTPRSPNCFESLYLVETPLPKSPQSRLASPMQPRLASPMQPRLASPMQPRLASPMQPYIKSCFQISRISQARDFMSSSCQYSPRERPKVFQSQKSGPSPPVSPDPSPNSSLCHPQKQNLSPYRPPKPSIYHFPKPMGLPEPPPTKAPSPRPVNRSPLAAELVTVEKHVHCNCSPRVETPLDVEFAYVDQSCSRRPVSPSLYEAVSRVLRPESPRPPMFQSLSPEVCPRLAPSPKRPECTCQKLGHKRNNNQFQYAAQIGSRSNSSNSTGQYRRVENASITQFLNDVKRILKKDLPSRMRPADQKQVFKETLKRDFYSSVRSALTSEFPFRDFPSSIRTDHNQELPSSGRTTDRKQELPTTDFLSLVRATLKPEFPSSSSGRTTDRKRDQKQEFSTPRNCFPSSMRKTNCKQEISSSSRATTERKQEHTSCVRTTERGTSPIIGQPVMVDSGARRPLMVDSGTNGAGVESDDRPKTAPVFTSTNNEAPSKPRPLQSGTTDHINVIEKPSKRSSQEDILSQESEEDYRYGSVQAIPKASDSKHPSKRNFNKRDTPSWMPRAAPKREEMLRCCCGMCKSTHSRRHFTTKCAYCANVHSCCCGMCSCPFRYCSSKSPIPDSESSTPSTSGRNDKLPFRNYPGLSRPKSLSPMTRRSYVAGIHEVPGKHGPRSKSARAKCKAQQIKERHPSPRALLKSFNSYLKSYPRRSKTGSRRCWHGHRRSPNWQYYSPPVSPEQNCSQRTKRSIIRRPQKDQLQQAPWGTHPILLSHPRPSNSRFVGAQIPQPRLISSGPHRGCCCPRCANAKL